MYGRFLLITILFFVLAAPMAARACIQPVFPAPDHVSAVYEEMKSGGELSPTERFLIESYEKDRDRYLEVYEQAYPCALYDGNVVSSGLTQEQSSVLKQELSLIERKWELEGITAENQAREETFVEVPTDKMIDVE